MFAGEDDPLELRLTLCISEQRVLLTDADDFAASNGYRLMDSDDKKRWYACERREDTKMMMQVKVYEEFSVLKISITTTDSKQDLNKFFGVN